MTTGARDFVTRQTFVLLTLSRFAPRVGLVTLRQTFVRHCQWRLRPADGCRGGSLTREAFPGDFRASQPGLSPSDPRTALRTASASERGASDSQTAVACACCGRPLGS